MGKIAMNSKLAFIDFRLSLSFLLINFGIGFSDESLDDYGKVTFSESFHLVIQLIVDRTVISAEVSLGTDVLKVNQDILDV